MPPVLQHDDGVLLQRETKPGYIEWYETARALHNRNHGKSIERVPTLLFPGLVGER